MPWQMSADAKAFLRPEGKTGSDEDDDDEWVLGRSTWTRTPSSSSPGLLASTGSVGVDLLNYLLKRFALKIVIAAVSGLGVIPPSTPTRSFSRIPRSCPDPNTPDFCNSSTVF